MAKERAKTRIHKTCRCPWHDWCRCGAARIAKELHQRIARTTTLLDFISTYKTSNGEDQKIYKNLCTQLWMNADRIEGAWRTYRTSRPRVAQTPVKTIKPAETIQPDETIQPEETTKHAQDGGNSRTRRDR